MSKQRKRVLVTGGSGFIGSNFVRCDVSKFNQVERMVEIVLRKKKRWRETAHSGLVTVESHA